MIIVSDKENYLHFKRFELCVLWYMIFQRFFVSHVFYFLFFYKLDLTIAAARALLLALKFEEELTLRAIFIGL